MTNTNEQRLREIWQHVEEAQEGGFTTMGVFVEDMLLLKQMLEEKNKHITDLGWEINPDRSGGAFTDQEIADSTGWR